MDIWAVTRTILEKNPGIRRKYLLEQVMKKTGLGRSSVCEHWTSLDAQGKIYREKGRYYLGSPSKIAHQYTVSLSEEQRQSWLRLLIGAEPSVPGHVVRRLVPKILIEVTQRIIGFNKQRQLPVVGFNMHNLNNYPLRFRVEARIILGGKELGLIQDRKGYYSGKRMWSLDPSSSLVNGSFTVPANCVNSSEELIIEIRVITIDHDGKEQELSPRSWTYKRDQNTWFYEPSGFTEDR